MPDRSFVDKIDEPQLRWLFDHWKSLAAGDVPLRRSFDPRKVPGYLWPFLFMLQREEAGYVIRLSGTKVDAWYNDIIDRKPLNDFVTPREWDQRLKMFDSVLATGLPVYYISSPKPTHPVQKKLARIALPMRSRPDKPPDLILGAAAFDAEHWIAAKRGLNMDWADSTEVIAATPADLGRKA